MVTTQSERSDPGDSHADAAVRRELYFFTLYRSLEGALFVFLAFSPLAAPFAELRHPTLAKAVALTYLVAAIALLLIGRDPRFGIKRQVGLGLTIDILAAVLAIHAIANVENGIALPNPAYQRRINAVGQVSWQRVTV